jgi:NAD(P)-dependent dehydrogenase (short-subunit alcohol dehydrogenase family)
MSVWFITGASRGFGLQLTTAALAAGDHVVATARDPRTVVDAITETSTPEVSRGMSQGASDTAHASIDRLLALSLDVTVEDQATAAVASAVERFGRIDVVVNNAGYGVFGSIEETPAEDVRALFDTNVLGLLNVTRAVLPVLRGQRSGHIVNMGSSAGVAAGAGGGLYSATKFAVEGITEALHAELTPLGIHVTVVEPGSFRTEFLTAGSLRRIDVSIPDYHDSVGALLQAASSFDGRQPGDPLRAVEAIRRLVVSPQPPLRLPLGRDSVELLHAKLAYLAGELATWREVSLSTDYPAGSA